jgi:type II secretory pathway component PulC
MPRSIVGALLLPLLATALACGPKVNPNRQPLSYELDDPEMAPAARSSAEQPVADAENGKPKTRWGSVDRARLLEVLDQGPAAFLAGVKIQPYFLDQRFAGWEIVSFWPRDSRFAAVDLQPGDVITKVNGRKIMKPKQLFDLWSKMREVSEIVVTGKRANEPFELRFQVIGGPQPPVP